MMKYILFLVILLLSVINVSATYPVQTGIYDSPYGNAAYIQWTTDITSSNRVEYSLNADMSASEWSSWSNGTETPYILLEDLTRDTPYYYNVSSTYGGDTTTSTTYTFETKNNTHGFSKFFDKIFIAGDIDGWSIGQAMFAAYSEQVGAYIVWSLFLVPVFLVIAIRTESVIIPVTLALTSASFIFPLLPPEFDAPAKILIGLAVSGILWHLFIGRR